VWRTLVVVNPRSPHYRTASTPPVAGNRHERRGDEGLGAGLGRLGAHLHRELVHVTTVVAVTALRLPEEEKSPPLSPAAPCGEYAHCPDARGRCRACASRPLSATTLAASTDAQGVLRSTVEPKCALLRE